eukprot:5253-Heterococcus_DN1.PRE.1
MGLLDQMTKEGVAPNSLTFAAVIKACGECDKWEESLAMMASMRKAKITITYQCYVAAITASGLCRNPESALEMLRTMETVDGVKPNLFTYTAALNALRDCGMGVEAVALLKEMKDLKLAPNEHSYTAAVEACSAGGHVRQQRLYYTYVYKQVACSVISLYSVNDVISRHALLQQLLTRTTALAAAAEQVFELLDDMKKSGVSMSTNTYAAAIRACRKQKQ